MALNTEEEQLIKVLEKFGPVVGLGRPGAGLPDLGAARELSTDEGWQERVLDLMDRARLVVLRLAETEGVRWEISKLTERLRPDQLLIIVPHGADVYRRLRPGIEELTGLRLPEFEAGKPAGSIQGMVIFDSDGMGRFLLIRREWIRTAALNPIGASIQLSAQPLFEQLGVAWAPPPAAPLRVWSLVLIGAWVIGLAIMLVAVVLGIGF